METSTLAWAVTTRNTGGRRYGQASSRRCFRERQTFALGGFETMPLAQVRPRHATLRQFHRRRIRTIAAVRINPIIGLESFELKYVVLSKSRHRNANRIANRGCPKEKT